MEYVGVVLLILALVVGWILTILNLPGNWVMVAAAALFAYFMPSDAPFSIGWSIVVALVALALVGEILEFVAGALGAKRAGGSRRSAVLALAGSLVGGILGVLIGLPIPVVGPVVAAILFAGGGALAGAMIGEAWKGRTLQQSWQVGQGAFWGRLFGTLAKTVIGSAMVVVGVVAALF